MGWLDGLIGGVFDRSADLDTLANSDEIIVITPSNSDFVLVYGGIAHSDGATGRIEKVSVEDFDDFRASLGGQSRVTEFATLNPHSVSGMQVFVADELILLNAIRDPDGGRDFLEAGGSQYDSLSEIAQFFNNNINMSLTYDSLALKQAEDPAFNEYMQENGISLYDFEATWAELADRANTALGLAEHNEHAHGFRGNITEFLKTQDYGLDPSEIKEILTTLESAPVDLPNQFVRFESLLSASPGG